MKRKFTTLLFGLLLAVGWTNGAQAQQLPAEAPVKQLMKAAVKPQAVFSETVQAAGSGVRTHSHPAALTQKFGITPNAPTKAPSRAGVKLDLKSISKSDADDITYTWDNGDGQGPRTSKSTDVAKDPYQMYELLREVYTNKAFPGPYYSAYTMDDVRERKVYYGAIEGGWDITGATLSGGSTSTMLRPKYVTGSKTVCDGTSTATGYLYLPVYSYYFETAQKNQMLYTASMLGLQAGDIITSLTFYPRSGITFYNGNVKLSLANTTTSTITSTSGLSETVTQVAATGTITANSSQTQWTITFDQPFTYTGNNLLVQIDTEAGSYGSNTGFYGTQQSTYQSYYYSRSGTTTGRSQFLPKATFGYKTQDGFEEYSYDPSYQIGDITISGTNNYAMISSIKVYSGSNTLFSWNFATDGTGSSSSTGYWPDGMTLTSWINWGNPANAIGFDDDLNTIVLDDWLFMGYPSVTVEIQAANGQSDYAASLVVNGVANNITSTYQSQQGAMETKTWTISPSAKSHTVYDPDYYKPKDEGYTALIVAVKNNATKVDWDNYEDEYDNGYHDTKQKIIDYLAANVDSIQLLTDGIRIGEGSDYSCGTVFNCNGTYNKFFYLGKGQARQKPDVIDNREIQYQHLVGEYVPFRYMFEQFSPTALESDSETDNFYSKMMEGNVYNVIHDCRSVLHLGHQFSMSGNAGTQAYAMTGMNFFIPDYRLKYWETEFSIYYTDGTIYMGPYTVDGRITNPYQVASEDGNPIFNASKVFRDPINYSFWYANYNQQYAPKVGLYKITLEAVAEPVANVQEEGNRNYKVTLTWVSSLNEMSGHDVPQTYTVYYYDPDTGEKDYLVVEGYTTVDGETGMTTLVYYVEQRPTSYIIDYVVTGTPNDGNEHPQFVAESNHDNVLIPGWNDFVGLELDHHESDFEAGDMANWYRNFLIVNNEDKYNGLSVAKITGYNEEDPSTPLTPMRSFNLYRWAIKEGVAQPEDKIATITFDQVYADRVHYTITYVDGLQEILEDSETPNKYERTTMNIPDEGWIRVKGNGDLVIWPNGFFVNFKSIIIKDGDNVLYEWNASSANVNTGDANLPEGWETSPGSMMAPYIVTSTGEKVCYMEGGGYIYIPNMVNTYNNLTVEIVAYTDGSHVGRVEVNDKSQSLTNAAATYTWGSNDEDNPISPAAAPKRDNNRNTTNN